MNVLIVDSEDGPGKIWSDHLRRQGLNPALARTRSSAIAMISEHDFDVLIVGLSMDEERVFSIADYASYRRPKARIIYVASDGFFSDGSVFNLLSNACAMVPKTTTASDLTALVHYHGAREVVQSRSLAQIA